MDHPNVPRTRRVKYKTIVRNDRGPVIADEEVIDTQEEYDAWIASCQGAKEAFPTPLDFDKEMVIAVCAGQQPTGGREISIIGVMEIVGGIVGIQWEVLYTVRADPLGLYPPVLTYPQHLVRTKKFGGVVTFRRVQQPAFTTMALGEEQPQPPPPQAPPQPTTLAVGEEQPQPTTLALGEEQPQPTTLAMGEEQPQPTTMALGEEQPQPTTLAVGEEQPQPTTLVFGEETVTTLAIGEETGGWGGGGFGGGFGGPFGAF